MRVFFKVGLGLLRVFLGCLCFFLKVFPVFRSLDTPPSSDHCDNCNGKSVFVSVGVFFFGSFKSF